MVMAKFTVDTANKLFIAKAGVTTFDVRVDLYSDAKEHWISDNTANKFRFPFLDPTTGRGTTQGGPDIDPIAGTTIPTYAFLEGGWRIRPDEVDHTLGVTGGILLVQGGGDPFVDTLGPFTVRINYQQPVQAIGVVAASTAATAEIRMNAAQIEATDRIRVSAFLIRDGAPVTTPLSASMTMWDDTPPDTILVGPLTQASPEAIAGHNPDSQGNFVWEFVQALNDDSTYSIDMTITDAVGPKSEREDLATMRGSS